MSGPTVIDGIRDLHDRATGSAVIHPEDWHALDAYIGPLLDVAEVAHELAGVTTHANVSGAEYADRKLMYRKLRLYLGRLDAAR